MRQCEHLYVWLMSELDNHAYADEVKRTNRMVDMIHSKTQEGDLKRILAEFPKGNIRVVIATVAFGLGIQVHDVDVVVNWEVESLLVYLQEVGRCARDGHQGYSIMYAYPRSMIDCKDDTVKQILSEKSCNRRTILKNFNLPRMEDGTCEFPQCNQECTIHVCVSAENAFVALSVQKVVHVGGNIEVTNRLLSTE